MLYGAGMIAPPTSPERFTFGVPLIGRAAADDWGLVDRLFGWTLRSVLAQRDGAFEVLVAGHDRPPSWALVEGDRRFRFLRADWAARAPSAANDDGGAKKWMVKRAVRDGGGGLLMFLDADDWIDRDLVGAARAAIGPDHVGALVTRGVAVDVPTGRWARMPVLPDFPNPFHQLCGSCTVARVEPDSPEPVRRDPHGVLGSHDDWRAAAAAGGHRLAELDVDGAYLVGTERSHSERQGPFAEWRRRFSAAVRAQGAAADEAMLARFGVAGIGMAGAFSSDQPGGR